MYEMYRLSPRAPRLRARLYIRAPARLYSIIASVCAVRVGLFDLFCRPRVSMECPPAVNFQRPPLQGYNRALRTADFERPGRINARAGALFGGLTQRSTRIGSMMGIKFLCPNGHKLHVKAFLSGKKAICPKCGVRVVVPADGQQVDDAQLDADSASSAAEAADSQATSESATQSSANSSAADAASPAAPGSTMADPIDDAPTAVWYVRPATGGQFGPASG